MGRIVPFGCPIQVSQLLFFFFWPLETGVFKLGATQKVFLLIPPPHIPSAHPLTLLPHCIPSILDFRPLCKTVAMLVWLMHLCIEHPAACLWFLPTTLLHSAPFVFCSRQHVSIPPPPLLSLLCTHCAAFSYRRELLNIKYPLSTPQ